MLIEKITPPPSKYVSVEKSFAIHIKWPDGYFDCVQSQCDNKYKLRYRPVHQKMHVNNIISNVKHQVPREESCYGAKMDCASSYPEFGRSPSVES